jgi:acetyl esterase/lipase
VSTASERAVRRRTLLAGSLGGLGGAAALLTGCGDGGSDRAAASPGARPVRRVRYGRDDQQHADLRRPRGSSRGTVVLVHGGYWQAGYGSDLMVPLAHSFTALGYATWNVEYRRVGSGGGFPETLEDVAAAIDALADQHLGPAVVVGHSAGGHLAAWAASRTADTPGGAPVVALRSAVSLSGLLDLSAAALAPESASPTVGFMGGTPTQVPRRYAVADPALLVPAACPVVACQAVDDQVVPRDQARRYVAAATAAHGQATLQPLPGDHFAIIDPSTKAVPIIRGLVAHALPDQ